MDSKDRTRIKVRVNNSRAKVVIKKVHNLLEIRVSKILEVKTRMEDRVNKVLVVKIRIVEHKVKAAKISRVDLKVIRDNRVKPEVIKILVKIRIVELKVNLEINKVLEIKVRAEDKPVDKVDKSLRIIRMVIRLVNEMQLTLRMDRDKMDNSSLRMANNLRANKAKEVVRMVNSNRADSKEANKVR